MENNRNNRSTKGGKCVPKNQLYRWWRNITGLDGDDRGAARIQREAHRDRSPTRLKLQRLRRAAYEENNEISYTKQDETPRADIG